MTTRVAPDAAARFRGVVYLLSAFSAVALVVALLSLLRAGDRSRQLGWTTTGTPGAYALVVQPDGPAAGVLHSGDIVLALNGDRHVQWWFPVEPTTAGTPQDAQRFIRADDAYTITVRRGDQELTAELKPAVVPGTARARRAASLFFVGAVWCIVATMIALFQSDLAIARWGYAAGITMGLFFVRQSMSAAIPWLPASMIVVQQAIFPISPMHLAIGFDFLIRLPHNAPPAPFQRWLRAALYVSCGCVAVIIGVADLVMLAAGQEPYSAWRAASSFLAPLLGQALGIIHAVVGVGLVSTLAYNFWRLERSDDRRRFRWVVWGTVVGVLPFAIVNTALLLSGLLPTPAFGDNWYPVANMATVLIPISFGYAIIKHQIFDISFVIRRGLQYLLAKEALRALILLPVAAVLSGLVMHRDEPIGRVMADNSLYLYLIAAAVVGLWVRAPMMQWIDRLFFRENYAREKILVELVEHVGQMDSASSVSKLVSHQIEAAFHPQSMFVWYREAARSHLSLSYSSGGHIHTAELGPDAPLVQLAERAPGVIDVLDPAVPASLPELDRAWLRDSRVRLIVPMIRDDREIVGLLMLGDRKSEEPYSADDVTLLQAVARQVAVAHENAALKDRVHDDRRVRHDVIAKLDPSRVNLLKECPECGTCYDGSASTCPLDRAELTMTLPIERTIDGKYRLARLLGKGGMGAVYEAFDLRLARTVAVKLLLGGSFGDRKALRRFEREAQATARLTHPNVVTVYDFGAVGADGAFIVMELVPGATLRAELRRLGARHPAVAAPWFEQIGAGVAAAHAQGIVHRDLKPENVVITRTPGHADRVRVLDFGLAKMQTLEHSPTGELTQSAAVMGTAGYMAPEQLTGGDIDERTDVFAIGVMAAETVTGVRPFTGRTISEHLIAILNQPLRLPEDGREWRHLEGVLQRSVAKHSRDRFGSVDEFMQHLVPALTAFPAPAQGADEPTTL